MVARENEGLPFAIDLLSRDTVVVYFANGRHPTPLVSGTVTPRDGTVIDGYKVFDSSATVSDDGRQSDAGSTGREIAVFGFFVHQQQLHAHEA